MVVLEGFSMHLWQSAPTLFLSSSRRLAATVAMKVSDLAITWVAPKCNEPSSFFGLRLLQLVPYARAAPKMEAKFKFWRAFFWCDYASRMPESALFSLQRLDADVVIQMLKTRSPYEAYWGRFFWKLKPLSTSTLLLYRLSNKSRLQRKIRGM